MTLQRYLKIIKNVEEKAPLESGIQALVYMLLFDIVESADLDLLIIDNMNKKSDFTTYSGISDIVIVDNDYEYNSNATDKIKMSIEIKASSENIRKYDEQLLGQLITYKRALITNGKQWQYYDIDKFIEDSTENIIESSWAQNDFEEIKKLAEGVIEDEKDLAFYKSKRVKEEEKISELERNIKGKRNNIKDKIASDINWLDNILDKPIWSIDLSNDNDVKQMYFKLIQNLNDMVSQL